MTPIDSLIGKLEQATGPDRELDAEIWLAVTPGATRKSTTVNHHAGPYVIDETRDAAGRLITVSAFTASLDSALTLVPEGWSIDAYIRPRKIGSLFRIGASYEGTHLTPAIALCIAALKARTSMESNHE